MHLGFPRISPKHFDLVVPTPEYPVPDAASVMRIPFALTPHAARPVEQSDRDLLNAYPQPRRLFLVGGPTLYWELPIDPMTDALRQLLDAAQKEGGSVLTVGSPRTPIELLAAMRQTLESSAVPFLFEPGDGPPAYPALIEAADEIFVTADSVAMVSDAILAKKPVGLVPIRSTALGRIYSGILDKMGGNRRMRPRDLRFFWAELASQDLVGTVEQARAARVPDYGSIVARRVLALIKR